jgi:hypothetical protein
MNLKALSVGIAVVMAALGLLVASAFAGGASYNSKSGANISIRFKTTVSGGQVKSIKNFVFADFSPPGCGYPISGFPMNMTVHSGSFHGSYTSKPLQLPSTQNATVSGHFFDHNLKATGTLKAENHYVGTPGLSPCKSGTVTWSASTKP